MRINKRLTNMIDKAREECDEGCPDYKLPPIMAKRLTPEEANEMWKKAPKAPLPPGSAGNPWGLH